MTAKHQFICYVKAILVQFKEEEEKTLIYRKMEMEK